MNQLSKALSAMALSAFIAVCSVPASYSYGADTETQQKFTVHYDISEDGIFIPEDEDGNVPELKDEQLSANSSFYITDIVPEKEGFIFSGWTMDDIVGYTANDVCRITDSDVTLHPVWVDENDETMHKIIFHVEHDGVVNEDAKKYVPDQKQLKGRLVEIPAWTFPVDGYKQRGWTDGVHEFSVYQKVIVHGDITFTPNMKKLYKLIYTVGDADRINGVTSLEFENPEGENTNLQALNRFSRNGFNNTGWHCEDDGKDYKAYDVITMPSHDVIMTPIWEPIRYNVLFKPTSGSAGLVKVQGYTDTKIVAPECTVTKEGYTFGGWQYGDTIVQPGEEYLIVGAKPGLGISFTAVWNPVEEEIAPYSHVINVYRYNTYEPVKDAQIYGIWTLINDGGVAQPLEIIDTSKSNPFVLSYEKYLNEKECSLQIISSYSDSKYFVHMKDYKIETDEENHITYHTVFVSERKYGDVNCDSSIDMGDVVLIMQSLANPNKYGYEGSDKNAITDLGLANADVWNSGDGVTGQDALHIQKYLLGLCEITAKVTVSPMPE